MNNSQWIHLNLFSYPKSLLHLLILNLGPNPVNVPSPTPPLESKLGNYSQVFSLSLILFIPNRYVLLFISIDKTSNWAIKISHINYYNFSTSFLHSFLFISNCFQFTSIAISNIVCVCAWHTQLRLIRAEAKTWTYKATLGMERKTGKLSEMTWWGSRSELGTIADPSHRFELCRFTYRFFTE